MQGAILERRGVVLLLGVAGAMQGCGGLDPIEPYAPGTGSFSSSGSGTSQTAGGSQVGGTATGTSTLSPDSGTTEPTGDESGTASAGSTGVCPVGDEGCSCTPGGGCNPGLMCISEVCVDPGARCPIGSAGCPCTAGGGCDPGLRCLSELCVDT